MFMCLILYDDIIWARRIVTRKVKVSKLSNEMLSIPFFLLQNAVIGCKEKYHNTCTSSFSMLENKNNSCEFQ